MDGDGFGGALFALVCTGIVIFCAVQAMSTFTSWANGGFALLAIAGMFGLWWLFRPRDPSALDIARKLVKKLEEDGK